MITGHVVVIAILNDTLFIKQCLIREEYPSEDRKKWVSGGGAGYC